MGIDPSRSNRYRLSAGKRFCRFFFQNRNPRVAQSRNSATLIADIQKFKGMRRPFYPEGSLSIDLSGLRRQTETEVSRVALWCYGRGLMRLLARADSRAAEGNRKSGCGCLVAGYHVLLVRGDGCSSGAGDDNREHESAESEFHKWLPLAKFPRKDIG